MSGTNKSGRRLKATTIVERRRARGDTIPIGRGIPQPDSHLSEVERKEWRRVARLLKDAGLLESLDKTLLAAYCVAYSRWCQAEEQVKKHGLLIKSPNDFPMPSPYLPIANKAMEQMLKILSELGMTPASRSRIPRREKEKTRRRPIPLISADPRDLLEGKV